MRYIHRDKAGVVQGHYANPQPYTDTVAGPKGKPVPKAYADDDPEILAWQQKRKDLVKAYQEQKVRLNPERLLGLIDELRQDIRKLQKG